MRRLFTLIVVCVVALTGCHSEWDARAVARQVKAHEQRLRAFADEWLSDGAFLLRHGNLNGPAAGESGWLQQISDGWMVVPRGDFRTRMDNAVWFWPAQGSSWSIQHERNVDVAANGRNTYRPTIVAMTIDEVAKLSNIPAGRLQGWMESVRRLELRSIGLDFSDDPAHQPLLVRIQFQGSGLAGVYYKPLGTMGDRPRIEIQRLWGPWYYFRDVPATDPL
jgi:hypothetical protein